MKWVAAFCAAWIIFPTMASELPAETAIHQPHYDKQWQNRLLAVQHRFAATLVEDVDETTTGSINR